MNFKEIIDCIFHNKKRYWEVTDDDKEKNFFIINQKFSRRYPKIGQMFNDKNIDKPSSLDRWFFFFENQYSIPQWYWGKRGNKGKKEKIYGYELIERENLKEDDIIFLNRNFKDELNKEVRKIKRYEKI